MCENIVGSFPGFEQNGSKGRALKLKFHYLQGKAFFASSILGKVKLWRLFLYFLIVYGPRLSC